LPHEIFNEEISEPLFNFRIAPFTTYSSALDQTSLGIGKKNEIKKKCFKRNMVNSWGNESKILTSTSSKMESITLHIFDKPKYAPQAVWPTLKKSF